MKFDWKEWLQVLSNFAILAGVVLVLIELRQADELARMNLSTGENMTSRIEFGRAMIGDSPEDTLAKACFEPDLLTDSDKLQLRRIMRVRILIAGRSRALGEYFGTTSWEQAAFQGVSQLFSIEYLRNYYRDNRDNVPDYMQNAANRALEQLGDQECSNSMTSFYAF